MVLSFGFNSASAYTTYLGATGAITGGTIMSVTISGAGVGLAGGQLVNHFPVFFDSSNRNVMEWWSDWIWYDFLNHREHDAFMNKLFQENMKTNIHMREVMRELKKQEEELEYAFKVFHVEGSDKSNCK